MVDNTSDLSRFVDPWAAGTPTAANPEASSAPAKQWVDPWGNQGGAQPNSAPQLPRSLSLPSLYGDPAVPAATAHAGYSVTNLPRDLGVAAAKGGNDFAHGMYEMANLASRGFLHNGQDLDTISRAATDEPISTGFARNDQTLSDLQSPEMQALQQKQAEAFKDGVLPGVKATLTNPALLASSAVGSWTYLLGVGGATRIAAETAFKSASEAAMSRALTAGLSKEAASEFATKAGATAARKVGKMAAVGANGVLMGSQSAASARSQVLSMSTAEIAKSPDYQNYLTSGMSPTDAKDKLAAKASMTAGVISGSLGALSTVVSGAAPMETEVFAKKLLGGEMTGKARDMIVQGAYNVGKMTAENAALGASSKFAENVGTGLANPAIQPGQGVGQAAGAGAVSGLVLGAGMEGFRQAGSRTGAGAQPGAEHNPGAGASESRGQESPATPPATDAPLATPSEAPASQPATWPPAAPDYPEAADSNEPMPASALIGDKPPEAGAAPATTPSAQVPPQDVVATPPPATADQPIPAQSDPDLPQSTQAPTLRKPARGAPSAPKGPVDILGAIAMAGGLSRTEAASQGIDPAHFALRGHLIHRVFTNKGLSFDHMARSLDELGYPVQDEKGNYNPNSLLDTLDKALAGHKVYRLADQHIVADQQYQQHLADQEAQHGAEHPVFGHISDVMDDFDASPEIGDNAALMAQARQKLGDDGLYALQERLSIAHGHLSDADYNEVIRGELENAVNGHPNDTPADSSGQPADGSGPAHGSGLEAARNPQAEPDESGASEARQSQIQTDSVIPQHSSPLPHCPDRMARFVVGKQLDLVFIDHVAIGYLYSAFNSVLQLNRRAYEE